MDHPAILADLSVLGKEVVDGCRAHLLHHRRGRVGASRLHGFEIVRGRRIDPRLRHVRHLAHSLEIALCPGTRLLIAVPVKGVGEQHALCRFQAKGVDVVDEDQQPRHFLPTAHDTELGRLLDGIGGVRAGVGKPDHLRFRGLRLQQRRREIQRVHRNPDAAKHPAAAGPDERGSDLLKVVAESIIGRQEKPCVVASLDRGGASAVSERVIVIRVMDRDRRACFVGDARRARSIEDDDLVFGLGKIDSSERGRRSGDIHERINVLDVEPFSHNGGSNVRLVQMIGGDDFDRFAQHLSAEIFYRHLGSSHRAHAGDVRVDARHVLEHANFHDAVGNLFLG